MNELDAFINPGADWALVFFLALALALFLWLGFLLGRALGRHQQNRYWENQLDHIRRDAIHRSQSVRRGHNLEVLAPWLAEFPGHPNEARFLGSPIDYIIFDGLDAGVAPRVIFLEIKTGQSRLSPREKLVRQAIERGQLEWQLLRLPGPNSA